MGFKKKYIRIKNKQANHTHLSTVNTAVKLTAKADTVQFTVPFPLGNILLEAEDLDRLFRAPFAEDVQQVGFTRLQGSAGHLQIVIAKGNRLCLLPLVVKHVDCRLMNRRDTTGKIKQRFYC